MRTKGTTREALSLLGLARRAGMVAGGTAVVLIGIWRGPLLYTPQDVAFPPL